ncbi:hypothetical protein BDQ17DRAFT_1014343 [Cyathus striatus]|nr:hypothetical protein BDQ17DRAFT_1014343 [Cyathus striatus]
MGSNSSSTKELFESEVSTNEEAEESTSSTEPLAPVSPHSRTARKPTNIRVLDAFGQETISDIAKEEQPEDSTSSRNKSSIRVVDAMGQEVGGEALKDDNPNHPPSSSERSEVLSRVRRGLDDLVKEITELDRTDGDLAETGRE